MIWQCHGLQNVTKAWATKLVCKTAARIILRGNLLGNYDRPTDCPTNRPSNWPTDGYVAPNDRIYGTADMLSVQFLIIERHFELLSALLNRAYLGKRIIALWILFPSVSLSVPSKPIKYCFMPQSRWNTAVNRSSLKVTFSEILFLWPRIKS